MNNSDNVGDHGTIIKKRNTMRDKIKKDLFLNMKASQDKLKSGSNRELESGEHCRNSVDHQNLPYDLIDQKSCSPGKTKAGFTNDYDSPCGKSPIKSKGSRKNKIQFNKKFEDKYKEDKILGEGANGLVKICVNKETNMKYAVKVMRTGDEEMIIQSKRAFKIQIALKHPNIAKAIELFVNENSETCYYIMEYYSWQNLTEVQQKLKDKIFNEKDSVGVLSQLLDGVDTMHQKGVCHRDLKPDNILLSEKSELKIIDFGIARNYKIRSKDQFSMKTSCSDMWTRTGTLYYQAPEFFDSVSYTEAVDMWAVGIITYEMLSGSLPFQHQYVQETIDLIIEGKFNFDKFPSYTSGLALDFIKRLITKGRRLRSKEASQHPWIHTNRPNMPKSSNVKQELKNCSTPLPAEQSRRFSEDVQPSQANFQVNYSVQQFHSSAEGVKNNAQNSEVSKSKFAIDQSTKIYTTEKQRGIQASLYQYLQKCKSTDDGQNDIQVNPSMKHCSEDITESKDEDLVTPIETQKGSSRGKHLNK